MKARPFTPQIPQSIFCHITRTLKKVKLVRNQIWKGEKEEENYAKKRKRIVLKIKINVKIHYVEDGLR